VSKPAFREPFLFSCIVITRTDENNDGPLIVGVFSGCYILVELINNLVQAVSIVTCILEMKVSILDSNTAYSKKFIVAFLRPPSK
jgi:hypothetical protein